MSLAALLKQSISVVPYSESGTDEYHSPVTTFGTAVVYKGYLEHTDSQEIDRVREP